MPHTSTHCVLVMPSDEALEGGYDSESNVGPFLSADVEYENLVSMDEVAPEEPALLPPPPDNGVGSTPESFLDKETINKMKVADLRIALEAHGLLKNGLKTVLMYQLKAAVGRGVPLIEDRPAVEVQNSAGNDLHPTDYWKEIHPSGDDIDESIMHVDEMRFRAPTTTTEEHEADCANRPKKRNYSETFDRSPFTAPCRLIPEKNSGDNFKRDSSGHYVYKKQVTDETVTNLEYLFENGIGFDSHPVEWFIPPPP